ncbi:hypothetical protein D3C87_1783990 [compost metagenome]
MAWLQLLDALHRYPRTAEQLPSQGKRAGRGGQVFFVAPLDQQHFAVGVLWVVDQLNDGGLHQRVLFQVGQKGWTALIGCKDDGG